MPELPEVEGVVRALAPIATGRTIQEVTVSRYGYPRKTTWERSNYQRNHD